ncbi:MAG: hypothetical protein ACRCZF_00635, partial [Gemmataceae bacterium]
NHAWLWGTVSYFLFQADTTGTVLVAVKAFSVLLAFVVLFRIRQAGQPIWPWVLFGLLAAVAAAPHVGLRPLTTSALFLALTLYLLFGARWAHGSYRNVFWFAALTWLWANMDGWFFLAPACILLVILGEMLQVFITGGEETTESDAEPTLVPTPPIKILLAAFGLSLVVANLTPHHLRVWQVPVEFGLSVAQPVLNDPYFVQIVLSPFNEKYRNDPALGNSPNGVAFATLLGLGLVIIAAAIGFGRYRVAPLLVWLAIAFLSFLHYRLILLFAIASVPLVAAAANALSAKFPRTGTLTPAIGMLRTLSGVGRLLTFVMVVGASIAAWPGWLQPRPSDPGYTNRVAWGVEPDPGAVRLAQTIEGWRREGRVPEGSRGFVLSPEVANYFAWFAPSEKVHLNGRYAFHAGDYEQLLKARKSLRLVQTEADTLDPTPLREVCEAHKIGYIVQPGMNPNRPADMVTPLTLSLRTPDWSVWHIDGRGAVLGFNPSRGSDGAKFDALAFDPIQLAMDPNQKPLVDGKLVPPPVRTWDWTDDFLVTVKAPPLAALDARVYHEAASIFYGNRQALYQFTWPAAWMSFAGGLGVTPFAPPYNFPTPSAKTQEREVALRLLAIRSARQSILDNPDHPEGYLALATVFRVRPPAVPGMAASDAVVQQVSAYRQYLDRLPSPKLANPAQARGGFEAGTELSELYSKNLQYADLYQDAVKLTGEYATQMIGENATGDERKAMQEFRDKKMKEADEVYATRNEAYELFAQRNPPPLEKIQKLLQLNLPGRAVDLFKETLRTKGADFGPQTIPLTLAMVQVEIRMGRLVDASRDLADLDEIIRDSATSPTADRNMIRFATAQVSGLRSELAKFTGDATTRATELENRAPRTKLTPEQKNVVTWAINPATWNGVFIGGNGAVGGAHGALLAMELANVQGY